MMGKLYKIRFLKDTELKKAGDIVNCSRASAESTIKAGYAEYVENDKPEIKKNKKSDEIKIKIIKEFDGLSVGKILVAKKSDAEAYVKNGIAEYVKEDKPEIKKDRKNFVDTTKYNWLLDPNRETDKIKVEFLRDCSGYKKGDKRIITTKEFLLFSDKGDCESAENTNAVTIPAFEDFESINTLPTIEEKHREWLKSYGDLNYTSEINHISKKGWNIHTPYSDDIYSPTINKVQRKKSRLVVEYDKVEGEANNAKESFEKTKLILEHYGIGYIQSTHNSENSDHLLIEFREDISTKEAKSFLTGLCIDGANIDMNFALDTFLFPVLYAIHWKGSEVREMPVKFFKGRKVDFASLKIPKGEGEEVSSMKNGMPYSTYTSRSKNPTAIFGIKGQVEQFYDDSPFCYNKSGMFLVWDNELKKYDIVDDTDMLNGIEDLGVDTVSSKMKTEILNALKQYGRRKIPKDAPSGWIQFKDKIFDYKTGEEFDATPEYLMTNPMPYNPGDSEETPIIDNLFTQWVGDDYKTTLEEIASYSACSDQFMQRMIALVGGGANGKGTYNKFLIKLLGEENTCSSEIKELSSNQFETSVIYKKQLCIMGEVSQGDLKNSNQLKKLSGEDKIRFCFKGKTPFSDSSITTLISNTNSLPRTPDKTMGFYRKWLIVDFPNQFTEIKHGLIENIPDVEMENFSRKILRILNNLYKTQKFTNEGTFQERMIKYEERSNPLPKFIEDNFTESPGSNVELKHFSNCFNKFAKENHLSMLSVRQIGKILRDDGFQTTPRKVELSDGTKSSSMVITNLKENTIETIETIRNLSRSPCVESNRKLDSFDSSDSNSDKPIKTYQKCNSPDKKAKNHKSEFKDIPTAHDLNKKVSEVSLEPIQDCQKCNAPMVENKCIGGCE